MSKLIEINQAIESIDKINWSVNIKQVLMLLNFFSNTNNIRNFLAEMYLMVEWS